MVNNAWLVDSTKPDWLRNSSAAPWTGRQNMRREQLFRPAARQEQHRPSWNTVVVPGILEEVAGYEPP